MIAADWPNLLAGSFLTLVAGGIAGLCAILWRRRAKRLDNRREVLSGLCASVSATVLHLRRGGRVAAAMVAAVEGDLAHCRLFLAPRYYAGIERRWRACRDGGQGESGQQEERWAAFVAWHGNLCHAIVSSGRRPRARPT